PFSRASSPASGLSANVILRRRKARRTSSTVRLCSASAANNRLAVLSPSFASEAARPPCASAVCLTMTRQLLMSMNFSTCAVEFDLLFSKIHCEDQAILIDFAPTHSDCDREKWKAGVAIVDTASLLLHGALCSD